MNSATEQPPKSDTGTFLVLAKDVEAERAHTHQFYLERHVEMIEHPDRWLPTKLSPTGTGSPSHYLCWYQDISDDLFTEMAEYIAMHQMAMTAERVPAAKTRREWLNEKGLKAIE
jgi:hypothetical protein